MQYNKCDNCKASDGRAGILWGTPVGDLCENCYQTRKSGKVTVNASLKRSSEEIFRTAELLNQKS